MKRFQRFLSVLLIACFANATMIQASQAALLTTEEVAAVAGSAQDRLRALLDRADVQAGLERMGLSPAIAKERVAALTDDEAAALANRIEDAPAGSGVLEVILTIFVVLLITDILGFTKVFPFTRSVR